MVSSYTMKVLSNIHKERYHESLSFYHDRRPMPGILRYVSGRSDTGSPSLALKSLRRKGKTDALRNATLWQRPRSPLVAGTWIRSCPYVEKAKTACDEAHRTKKPESVSCSNVGPAVRGRGHGLGNTDGLVSLWCL